MEGSAVVAMGGNRYACELDPYSIVGLTRLARENPRRWRRRLWDGVPDATKAAMAEAVASALRQDWEASLQHPLEVVLLAFGGAALPNPGARVSVQVVRQNRQLLAAIASASTGFEAEFLFTTPTQIHMFATIPSRIDGKKGLSPGRYRRAMALVRRVLTGWAALHGKTLPTMGQVKARKAASSPRHTLSIRYVAELLHRARVEERVKLGLAVGVGLWGHEIERLSSKDFGTRSVGVADRPHPAMAPGKLWFVRVRASGGGNGRIIPLPPWLGDLVDEAIRALGPRFMEMTPKLESTLRRLKRGGLPASATQLRDTYKGIARSAGATREVVRGSWRQPMDGPRSWPSRWHWAQVGHWQLAQEWTALSFGPATPFIQEIYRLPSRPPSRCAPDEPELKRRGGRTAHAPLPERVTVGLF